MHTILTRIVHWQWAAVVLSVAVTPLAAAPTDAGTASSPTANAPSAMRLSSSKPGQITLDVGLDTPHPGIQAQVMGKDTLRLADQLPPRAGKGNCSSCWDQPGLKFEARVRVICEGGRIDGEANQLKVRITGFTKEGDPALVALYYQFGRYLLLPELPKVWSAGSVRGLRARGGFEVDCTWRDGRLSEATIRSKHNGPCRVFYDEKLITLDTKAGQSYHLNGELTLVVCAEEPDMTSALKKAYANLRLTERTDIQGFMPYSGKHLLYER